MLILIFEVWVEVRFQYLRCNPLLRPRTNGLTPEISQFVLFGESLRVAKVHDSRVMIVVDQNIAL